MQRGLIAEINLNNLCNNLKLVKSLAKGSEIIAVVKADAYGHGSVEVSKRLLREGINTLAVAFTSEAVQLRAAGISCKILSLFDSDHDSIINYNLTPTLNNLKTAQALSSSASKKGLIISSHLKVDTGMGRTGFHWYNKDEILKIFSFSGLNIEGIMSHFSDADLNDKEFAEEQIKRLKDIQSFLLQKGIRIKLWHISNSAGLMSLAKANFDAVRPGLMLYGYSPLQNIKSDCQLQPVMSVKTNILQIRKTKALQPISYGKTFITKRDSTIAVLSAGYADGLNRLFSNNLDVLIEGKRAPVIGRVCMDLTMVDVTDIKEAKEQSKAILIGSDGDEYIDANELAKRIGTISYEILTTFGSKARRTYTGF